MANVLIQEVGLLLNCNMVGKICKAQSCRLEFWRDTATVSSAINLAIVTATITEKFKGNNRNNDYNYKCITVKMWNIFTAKISIYNNNNQSKFFWMYCLKFFNTVAFKIKLYFASEKNKVC